MKYYDYASFCRDVAKATSLLEEVSAAYRHIMNHLHAASVALGFKAQIKVVGSTSPERMTCVIDPVAPNHRYACDFDICLIWPKTTDKADKAAILNGIYPDGSLQVKKDGRVELSTHFNNYPINIAIADSAEYLDMNKFLPLFYSSNQHLSETQKDTARALRLFCMRSGIYGGYTRGFKGIALEELAKIHEDFMPCIETIARQSKDQHRITIASSVDGKNLCEKLSVDILSRTDRAVHTLLNSGHIRKMPYSIDSWREDHPEAQWLRFETEEKDPHESYLLSRKITEQTLRHMLGTSFRKHAQFVMPQISCNEVFVAAYGLKESNATEWRARFHSNWKLNS